MRVHYRVVVVRHTQTSRDPPASIPVPTQLHSLTNKLCPKRKAFCRASFALTLRRDRHELVLGPHADRVDEPLRCALDLAAPVVFRCPKKAIEPGLKTERGEEVLLSEWTMRRDCRGESNSG